MRAARPALSEDGIGEGAEPAFAAGGAFAENAGGREELAAAGGSAAGAAA